MSEGVRTQFCWLRTAVLPCIKRLEGGDGGTRVALCSPDGHCSVVLKGWAGQAASTRELCSAVRELSLMLTVKLQLSNYLEVHFCPALSAGA